MLEDGGMEQASIHLELCFASAMHALEYYFADSQKGPTSTVTHYRRRALYIEAEEAHQNIISLQVTLSPLIWLKPMMKSPSPLVQLEPQDRQENHPGVIDHAPKWEQAIPSNRNIYYDKAMKYAERSGSLYARAVYTARDAEKLFKRAAQGDENSDALLREATQEADKASALFKEAAQEGEKTDELYRNLEAVDS
ncbi:MAG: hypothetical protein V6Z81_09445 [Parvularculales bacterium]